MSDEVKLDAFIAKMAVRFALDQVRSQSQHAEQNHTIDNARPFDAGKDIGSVRDNMKYLG